MEAWSASINLPWGALCKNTAQALIAESIPLRLHIAGSTSNRFYMEDTKPEPGGFPTITTKRMTEITTETIEALRKVDLVGRGIIRRMFEKNAEDCHRKADMNGWREWKERI